MATSSPDICFDSSAWIKGLVSEEVGMASSLSPSASELIACPAPPVDRRLRPQQEQPLKCPRCDSTHTKFCYYNNYSLSQPRYFCKTCRRYWTKGGSLRNVPVGGGCRKNNRQATRKPSGGHRHPHPADLQLSFPEAQQQQHLHHDAPHCNLSVLQWKYHSLLAAPVAGPGLLDVKLGDLPFLGGGDVGSVEGSNELEWPGFPGLHEFRCAANSSRGPVMDCYQGLEPPFEAHEGHGGGRAVKPEDRVLALEWPEECCHGTGYPTGMGCWPGMVGGHGP